MRLSILAAVLAAFTVGPAASPASAAAPWHTAWARSQAFAPTAPPLVDQTVRVVTRLTASGTSVRVRLQNAFGKSTRPDGTPPLTIDAATLGRRTSGAEIAAGTLRRLTFDGQTGVTIPSGAWVDSDRVDLPVTAGEDLVVSAHTPFASPPAHFIDTVTNYVSGLGDATADLGGLRFTSTTTTTPIVAAVHVAGTPPAGTVVAIGGSVVDGTGSTLDGHDAWPDVLARRLAELPPSRRKAVVNAGIGSTTAARPCASSFGPAVQDRLQRDALGLKGVTDVIVYAGTNDLAGIPPGIGRCNAQQIIDALRDIARQTRDAGVRLFITAITPRGSYTDEQDADRATVNAWVRAGGNCSGECDGALDFDAAVRDPQDPSRIDPKLDSGDGIHPNPEGYARIAASIDLDALSPKLPVASPRRCRSRRIVRFTLPRGTGRVRVLLNGRTARVRRAGRVVVLRLVGETRPSVRVMISARGYRRVTTLHLCATSMRATAPSH